MFLIFLFISYKNKKLSFIRFESLNRFYKFLFPIIPIMSYIFLDYSDHCHTWFNFTFL